jgi:hypothetical protein
VISFILLVVYYLCRSSLKLCAEMFKFAAIGIENNMCLLPVQGLFFLLAVMIKIMLIAMFVAFVCVFEVTPNPDYDPNDPYGLDFDACQADVQDSRKPYYVFFVIVFGWFAFWVNPAACLLATPSAPASSPPFIF